MSKICKHVKNIKQERSKISSHLIGFFGVTVKKIKHTAVLWMRTICPFSCFIIKLFCYFLGSCVVDLVLYLQPGPMLIGTQRPFYFSCCQYFRGINSELTMPQRLTVTFEILSWGIDMSQTTLKYSWQKWAEALCCNGKYVL